jgi:uncharacterized membrane protein YagU involved in acid resistance
MDWQGWITFGFVATVALTGIMVAAQMAGLSRMDLPLLLGTVVTPRPEVARGAGLVIHMINGQIFALLYASAFASIGRATWWMGLTFGALHGVASLVVVIPFLPAVHPRMASDRSGPALAATLEPPGLLALNYGVQTPVVALIAHLVYGLILGMFLGPR